MKLLEYLWLPLRVFHTDTDFHVVKYLAVFDVMVYQYSDDYVQQLKISKEKKRNNLFNDRKFLVTTLNLLYNHNFWYGDKDITNLVNEVRRELISKSF